MENGVTKIWEILGLKIFQNFPNVKKISHSTNVSLSTDKSFESYGAFVGLRIVVFSCLSQVLGQRLIILAQLAK